MSVLSRLQFLQEQYKKLQGEEDPKQNIDYKINKKNESDLKGEDLNPLKSESDPKSEVNYKIQNEQLTNHLNQL